MIKILLIKLNKLKITMERPKNVPNPENSTPVVYQYKLIVETGGENIEY